MNLAEDSGLGLIRLDIIYLLVSRQILEIDEEILPNRRGFQASLKLVAPIGSFADRTLACTMQLSRLFLRRTSLDSIRSLK